MCVAEEDLELFQKFSGPGSCIEVVPQTFAGVRGTIEPYGQRVHSLSLAWGWTRQQIVKLAAWQLASGSFYVAMDADMFFVRPVVYGDLIKDGRAVFNRDLRQEDKRRHYEDSFAVLGGSNLHLTKGPYVAASPPFVLSTQICRLLREDLQREYGVPWLLTLALQSCIHQRRWTESSIHHLVGLRHDLWDKLYVEVDHRLTARFSGFTDFKRRADWRLIDETWKNLDVRKFFAENPESLFGVVHSWTNIEAEAVREKIRCLYE